MASPTRQTDSPGAPVRPFVCNRRINAYELAFVGYNEKMGFTAGACHRQLKDVR